MSKIKLLFRLIYINYVLAKYGLDEIVLGMRFFAPIRFLVYLNPWNWIRDKNLPRGARVRHALEELGPIFVKFGQTLSTRPDLIPEDISQELAQLQDQVPPFANAQAIVEAIYQRPVSELFLTFNPIPLASASIAQVHEATLPNGKHVVVKVLRPGIKKIIQQDVYLLTTIAELLERYWRIGRRLRARAIVTEFEQSLLHELDLQREAANASQLRRNFHDSPLLYIPEIYWPYTQSQILVMERIHGIPISHVQELRDLGVDLKKLAERGVEIFFTQVFRDCFFHADMHPGNIFVSKQHPENPQYIAVDFGIVGSLSSTDQRYLAENMLAFFKRDYARVAQLHIASGWVPPDTRVDAFEAAIRTVCEPVFERPWAEISFGQLFLRLFQTGKQFHMQVQPQLLLLQKTLIHIEGLGRQLYPELDLWTTGKPYLEKWLKNQVSPFGILRKVSKNLPYWLEKLPEIPDLLYENLYYWQKNQQQLLSHRLLVERREESKLKQRKGFLWGAGFAFLFCSIFGILLGESLGIQISLDWLWGMAGLGLVMWLVALGSRE